MANRPSISKERIKKAAAIYKTNAYAAEALGLASGSFGRLCRRYNIETPMARSVREKSEAFERRQLKTSAVG